ncbi:hypothetical protein VHA01S_030_00110 [Vibrio halioticoli NBRC 102217]|uniref:4Fe-4S ferredoxin-type domain-containing protein n=1 Tax=Vibrio halioticoli NBRC 102217 TaxID=1219072 RepID=V5FJK4_9VIBR|nr:4Fe-4S binding protein [Vibrio halioticoli]GAD89936.1 hypothetical protein VHA01S_030_00110 [Vibrio halioticoli NBRC 102217]
MDDSPLWNNSCYQIHQQKCIQCRNCEPICPVNAIRDETVGVGPGGTVHVIYIHESCICCAKCLAVCPVSAIDEMYVNSNNDLRCQNE